jgi:hypothetical protein
MPDLIPPQELLDNLHDIHLPFIVGWWPPAPGWWVITLCLIFLSIACWRAYRRHQRSLKVQALNELKRLSTSQQPSDQWITSLSALLKRVAISRFGRSSTASLHGQEWLDFLNEQGQTDFFSLSQGLCLGESLYQSSTTPQIDQQALLSAARQWIKYTC